MKVLIVGSREFQDYDYLDKVSVDIISREQYEKEIPCSELEIVSGHAEGADRLAENFAFHHGLPIQLFPADWNRLEVSGSEQLFIKENFYGKYNAMAGVNRNTKMVEWVRQNGGGIVIAFIQGDSKGAKDTIRKSKIAGLKVYQVDYEKKKVKVIENETVE